MIAHLNNTNSNTFEQGDQSDYIFDTGSEAENLDHDHEKEDGHHERSHPLLATEILPRDSHQSTHIEQISPDELRIQGEHQQHVKTAVELRRARQRTRRLQIQTIDPQVILPSVQPLKSNNRMLQEAYTSLLFYQHKIGWKDYLS